MPDGRVAVRGNQNDPVTLSVGRVRVVVLDFYPLRQVSYEFVCVFFCFFYEPQQPATAKIFDFSSFFRVLFFVFFSLLCGFAAARRMMTLKKSRNKSQPVQVSPPLLRRSAAAAATTAPRRRQRRRPSFRLIGAIAIQGRRGRPESKASSFNHSKSGCSHCCCSFNP